MPPTRPVPYVGAPLKRLHLRGEGFYLSGHDRALGDDVVKRDEAAPVEIRRLGGGLRRRTLLRSPVSARAREPEGE